MDAQLIDGTKFEERKSLPNDKEYKGILMVFLFLSSLAILISFGFFFGYYSIDSSPTKGWQVGFIVGGLPCVAMIIGCICSYLEPSKYTEACFQNAAAGLLMAAIGLELFPMMEGRANEFTDTDRDMWNYIGGSGIGMALGLALLFGVEHVMEKYEEDDDEEEEPEDPRTTKPIYEEDAELTSNVEYSKEDLQHSSLALMQSAAQSDLKQSMQKVVDLVSQLDKDVKSHVEGVDNKTDLMETIDRNIHVLQYSVDHTRRVLEGYTSTSKSKLAQDELKAMKSRIGNLRRTAEHLNEHMQATPMNREAVAEVFQHINDLEHQLSQFHATVEQAGRRWRRNHRLRNTKMGEMVPFSLIFPVFIDAFVDGILLGVTSVLSLSAGIEVCVATCLEMGFLGLAVGARVSRCTGSFWSTRVISMYGPPFTMLFAAMAGASFAKAISDNAVVTTVLVAFGATALTFLAFVELIPEAKEAHKDDPKWWITGTIFIAIFVVIVFDIMLTTSEMGTY